MALPKYGPGGSLPGWPSGVFAPLPATPTPAPAPTTTYAPTPTPTTTNASAPSSSYTDLYNMALNSPWYQQALAASNANNAAAGANRKSQIQQMLIQFGLVPQGFQDKYGDLDPTTRGLAEGNTKSGISAYARLLQAHKDQNRALTRRLSASGMRRSGTKGYQLRRNQLGFDQGFSDAVARLLGSATNVYGNYANTLYGNQTGLSNALSSAINSMGDWYGGGSDSQNFYSQNPSLLDYQNNLALGSYANQREAAGGTGASILWGPTAKTPAISGY